MIRLGVLGSTNGTDLQAILDAISKKVLIGRQQRVSELFGIFRYLCSEESSYVTCETFRINGGYAQK